MTANQPLLSGETQAAIEKIAAAQKDIEGRRAAALIAVSDGQSYAEAAEANGLTEGQVGYIVRKFREQGLDAFPSAAGTTSETAGEFELEAEELRAMIKELDARVTELQLMVDQQPLTSSVAVYSPARLLTMVRDNAQKLTPEMQLDVLRNFQGMSAEDLLDLETWKGVAYMTTYSARFQAGQIRSKVFVTINQVVPEPVQPGRLWRWGKSSLARITPDFAKQILGVFQDASREDLVDPDTWKGVWYMISYSLHFQAEQLKERLVAAEESQSQE